MTVASTDWLATELVRAALERGGQTVHALRWRPAPVRRSPAQQLSSARPDVGLMLCDLRVDEELSEVLWLLDQHLAPWVVVGRIHPAAAGALVQAGAAEVLPPAAGLDHVVGVLAAVAAGRNVMAPERRQRALRAWLELDPDQVDLVHRMRRLSPRERLVLAGLRSGQPPAEIAEGMGVSLSTVRTQLQSVLRKLGLQSQLAAVAAVRLLTEEHRWVSEPER